jgi:hypothetical protein
MPLDLRTTILNIGPESVRPQSASDAKSKERTKMIARIQSKAKFLRYEGLKLNSRTLHAGAALSSADIIACLFYHVLRLDPKNPAWADRDIFINSRGHACEPVYVALADLGFFPWDDLQHVEDFGSHLHGLTATTTPGIEFSTGALPQRQRWPADQIQLWRSYTGMASFLASGVAMVVGSLLKPTRANPETMSLQGTAGGVA